MFKQHPKGLIPAALANMGERFGFYTMMAILLLFLISKLGLDGKTAALIYSIFYFSIYVLAFVGGLIADKTRKYKATILSGLVLMTLGYLMLAIPSQTPIPAANYLFFFTVTCGGLFVIAFGNGLFKGNLQALVGQMYDAKEYSKMRDTGFSIFYMFINIGGIFAPLAAMGARAWWLGKHNFLYDSNLTELCYQYINGTITTDGMTKFTDAATAACTNGAPTDLMVFANDYINVFTTGFHYSFAIAAVAMVVSLVIFIINRRIFPNPQKIAKKNEKIDPNVVVMGIKEIKQRIYALLAVFLVVIFFWFSFHQNGVTLTLFAKDYTHLNLFGFDIAAEFFQSLNPLFVVLLTPIVIAFFNSSFGLKISTPKKIAIGMAIAAFAFVVIMLGSFSVPTFEEMKAIGGVPTADKVSPYLLFTTYLILTIAELFISPLGISFVSKVAPPQYQGLMQGGWLTATALGNLLLFIGVIFYESIPIWATWGVFVFVCLCSMTLMLIMLKWLERVTK